MFVRHASGRWGHGVDMVSRVLTVVVVGVVVVGVVGDIATDLVAVLGRARSLPYRNHIGRDLPLRLCGVVLVKVVVVAGDGSRGGDLALVVEGGVAADGVCLVVVVGVHLGAPVLAVGVVGTLLLAMLLSRDEGAGAP